jgi:predicted outer membrane repeat protein
LDLAVKEWPGRDDPACIQQGNEYPCKTLQYLLERLKEAGIDSNVTITIKSRLRHSLTLFDNFSDLNVIGPGTASRMNRDKTCRVPGGIVFSNITTLYFSNFHVRLCGYRRANHTTAILIRDSTNVTIEDVHFEQCRETALLIAGAHGSVSIKRVVFHDNRLFHTNSQVNSYSGGMEVILSDSKGVYYVVEECVFSNNSAPGSFSTFNTVLNQDSEWRGNSVGGGLGVYFQGNSTGNTISIINCTFQHNFARWGAGMHVIFQNQAMDNVLEVIGSEYLQNTAFQAGGGVCVRYFVSDPNRASHFNSILFREVKLNGNHAGFGAGTTILSVYSTSLSTCKVTFADCAWSGNSADYASAVNVAPALFQRLENGHLPIPEFIHSKFEGNYLGFSQEKLTPSLPRYYTKFAGILVITKSQVNFAGNTRFIDNTDSALYIISGKVTFREGSDVTFVNNTASRGGAIAAYGYTSLVFSTNSAINFTHNHASELGAAIYYKSFDQHDFKSGRECFLKVSDETSDSNITVTFDDNTAEIAGNAVYASTLYPCFYSNDHRLASINHTLNSNILDFIGDIHYDNSSTAFATNGRQFKIEDTPRLFGFIPGQLTSVSVHPLDEFYQSSEDRFALLVVFENGLIKADREYTIKGRLRFFGRPGTNDVLNLILAAPRQIILSINVTMLSCPPGFYFDSISSACKCTALTEDLYYYGIVKCDVEKYRSFLLRGFWIGYVPSSVQEPENLYTAVCPLNFCRLNSLSNYTSELPNNSSELNERVCAVNREGIVCGSCSKGYSPFFHSESFKCGPNKLCSVGIVFYLLSEVIPVVFLFTFIITFDFSFTSGNINGFIFYSQTLGLLSTSAKIYDKHSNWFIMITRVFYDLFNLDYFSTSELSFCLWKGATVIDVLAFKYVTVTFAFGLVVLLILIMRHFKCTKLEELLKIKERLSITKGLSAFLVICYAQCAKTSFYILTPILLRTHGGEVGETVTLFGGLPFLKGRHLFYAIVAILFILTIVIIPPLVLTLYPLSVQLLGLCKLSEHWLVEKLLKILQIYRLKPLIDSFQGCYRDRFRFFAGLYFIYRILILASYSITRSTSQFFVIAQFLLLAFIGVHSVVQPYKKQVHNILDSLVFSNLVFINGCTIFLDVYNVESRENHFAGGWHFASLFVAVQIFLMYIPMVCFILWMGVKLKGFASQFCTLTRRQSDDHSSITIEEGLLSVVDYHEMRAAAGDTLSGSVQEPPEDEESLEEDEQPKIKIRRVPPRKEQ